MFIDLKTGETYNHLLFADDKEAIFDAAHGEAHFANNEYNETLDIVTREASDLPVVTGDGTDNEKTILFHTDEERQTVDRFQAFGPFNEPIPLRIAQRRDTLDTIASINGGLHNVPTQRKRPQGFPDLARWRRRVFGAS